ncbi:GNAT family N-acetyltransferase [Hyalangium rubrum]|uniref:GNAT family N-acetyltransferase n=1 Tax=Hyalangium rubrum TaxID=3103134 RepID=A0ABU5HI41_9BACT|nr:GNAT family N-acetyltransferase [Hyalangium sp. s54d21]MDY7232544.1 GNAT family N-acetyltransferase [Hyalangium sp. s54d21]
MGDNKLAEQVSLRTFLNCYLRETSGWALIDVDEGGLDTALRQHLRKRGVKSVARLPFEKDATEVWAPVAYFSETGHHRYAFPLLSRAVGAGSLHPMNFDDFVTLVTTDLARVRGADPVALDELRIRALDSCENIATFLEARSEDLPRLFGPELSFIEAEQGLLTGHPLHPTPKSRSGFEGEELERYSPELGGAFALHYFAADPSVVRQDSALAESASTLIKKMLREDAEVPRSFKEAHCQEGGFVLIPVHPWQAQKLLQETPVKELLAKGLLKDLGTQGRAFQPTSSVRTVYHADAPFMFKLSLQVRITNSERVNLFKELLRGVELYRLMEGPLGTELKERFPQFKVIGDPAYVAVVHEGKVLDGFSCVMRENPFPGDSHINATPLATLCAENPEDGGTRAGQIIRLLAEKEQRPVETVAREWFRKFLSVTLHPFCWMHLCRGLGLEAHQQNTVLELKDGYPHRAYYRDNQGVYYRDTTISQLRKHLPELGIASEAVAPEDLVDERLGYYLIINNMLGMVGALGSDGVLGERALLAELRQSLWDIDAACKSLSPFVRRVLATRTLRCKANLLTRLQGLDELLAPVAVQSVYVEVKNPFCIERKVPAMTQNPGCPFWQPDWVFAKFDESLQKWIGFRRLEYARDLHLIHEWMNLEHVEPFWNMAKPLPVIERYLRRALEDAHHTLYIGMIDGVPMSYWERYWVVDDILGRYYPVHPTDQGCHLLIGPFEFLQRKVSVAMLRAFTEYMFLHPETERVVGEPDARNRLVLEVAKQCGGEVQMEVELPDKRAALLFYRREKYFPQERA